MSLPIAPKNAAGIEALELLLRLFGFVSKFWVNLKAEFSSWWADDEVIAEGALA